ncbi:MAG: hypothetical protein WD080_07170 [Egibacteraceae bacterium]
MVFAVGFAVLGALVAGAFSAELARQWRARRRHHALAWSLSLALYAAGMVALAAGFGLGWSPASFAVYWITGALLNVPLLAVGQLHLLDSKRAALWWTIAGLATVWSVAAVALTPVEVGVLAAADGAGGIPGGQEAFAGGLAYQVLRPMTILGALVVVVGSVYSGLRARRYGILLIALGVAVSATSSRFLAAELDHLVALVLAVGVTVMYAGFRAARRAPRARRETTRVRTA